MALALAGILVATPGVRANGATPDTVRLAYAVRLRRQAIQVAERSPYSPSWADTLWARVLALPTPWQWDALSHLASRKLAAGDAAGADSLIEHTSQAGWPIEDRAARLALAARARAAMGDTAAALADCRQTMRAYPSALGARAARATFDSIAVARADSGSASDAALAAEVQFWAGDRAGAILRLERALRLSDASDRWRTGLRLAEVQRLARRLVPAQGTLDRCLRRAPDDAARARVWLERARVQRDAGSFEHAYLAYARAATLAPETSTAEAARWELGREAEEHSDWPRAERAYLAVERLGLKRAADARLRRGLGLMNAGHTARARACFAGSNGEAARFWWAISAAESSANARHQALDSLASTPGYSFYRAAARESLSRSGWPSGLSAAPPAAPSSEALSLFSFLIDSGAAADAAFLIDRWAADDPRAGAPADGVARHPYDLLFASSLDARAARPRDAVRLAQRACEALADSSAPQAWMAWWHVYPQPAGSPDDLTLAKFGLGLEPALLRAVIWKESHFDSGAVSRTGAIGLTQLMPETARLLARRLGDAPPTDSMLAQPAINVRYGAAYLASLAQHFGGRVTLALAAYNAGTRAADRWGELYRRGGEAMQCELIAYPETQDYVKGILAARAAYREMAAARAGPR
jgi:soluble lytic murein transglycosylase-like protein/Tfp pilus assembly protein PilF